MQTASISSYTNILLLILAGSSGFPTCRHLFVANFSFRYWVNFQRNDEKKTDRSIRNNTTRKKAPKKIERKEFTQKQMEMPINGTRALREKAARRTHKLQIFEIRACFCNGNGTLLVSCPVPSLRYSCHRCHRFFYARSLLDCHLGDALLDDASFPLFVLYCIVLPF